MKIGIDTFGCDHSRTGNGSYLLNFINNLPDNSEQNAASDFKFELFGFESDRYTYKSPADISFTSIDIKDNLSAETKWHDGKISKFLWHQDYDVVIYPAADTVIPKKFGNQKSVAVINSIISHHERHNKGNSLHHILKGLHNVDLIIAASECIRLDLIKNDIPAEKIAVIHNGIDHKLFFPDLDTDGEFVEVKPFSIKKPYFVYGSRLSGPDKKHIELIKAFELFKKITGAPYRLVISGNISQDGKASEYAEQIHKAAYESEYSSDIFLTGYFPHDSFSKLYAGAAACIFPAVNEGVGLPVLEAMACGIPVMCADSGALREVGGNATLFFNPDNIPETAECMQKLTKDDDASKEQVSQMVNLGLERSRSFSWQNTVEQTLKIIKERLL